MTLITWSLGGILKLLANPNQSDFSLQKLQVK